MNRALSDEREPATQSMGEAPQAEGSLLGTAGRPEREEVGEEGRSQAPWKGLGFILTYSEAMGGF